MLTATASSLLLSACGQAQPQDEAEPDRSASPSGPELLIGVSLELTGRGAALGVPQDRALRITLEDLNVDRVQVGNQRRSVRVLVRDNRSDPRLAAQQAGRLRAYLQTQVTEGMAGWYAFAPIRHGGMERDSLGVYQLTQGGWARVS
ncbi:hypothetical protein ABT214_33075 [Micromonospora purpureochromogenes]|uniref:hypothetical protein n=1 Tax=Micromonospora purpureochromogenes TaxID=47872 RepID=UPI0033197049